MELLYRYAFFTSQNLPPLAYYLQNSILVCYNRYDHQEVVIYIIIELLYRYAFFTSQNLPPLAYYLQNSILVCYNRYDHQEVVIYIIIELLYRYAFFTSQNLPPLARGNKVVTIRFSNRGIVIELTSSIGTAQSAAESSPDHINWWSCSHRSDSFDHTFTASPTFTDHKKIQ